MVTDQRTGMRSIYAARETFAAVALAGLTFATVLRCIDGRAGGVAGAILTFMGLAVVSRFKVSWDEDAICWQTPWSSKRIPWTGLTAYSIEPESHDRYGMRQRQSPVPLRCRLRLHARGRKWTVGLGPYSWQDIAHLTNRVSREIPAYEDAAALVS